MKTTKCALVIAILAFVTLSYASVDPGPMSVKISLKAALENRHLVRAMYEQLDNSFLQNEHARLYTARVVFNHSIFYISGTYDEWMVFFSIEPNEEPVTGANGNHLKVKPIK
jgi:hypothetical protein